MPETSYNIDSKWVWRYMALAEQIASWSKDPSTKVGAVIVGENGQIIAQGYNGFPRGVNDSDERYNDRPVKYKYVVHAEMNAILNALYNGASVRDATLYVHALPVCNECAKAIIQAGIKRVVMDTPVQERWKESWDIAKTMFEEAGVVYSFIGKFKIPR
jgi:dCMP deaminase